jgi:hypothetical protein
MNIAYTLAQAEPIAIGRYRIGDTGHFLPFSNAESERATAFYLRILSTFHFRTGLNVMVTAQLNECLQFLPFERAAMAYGQVVCSADSTLYDAGRVESILRRFQPVAVAGLSAETLAGLEAFGHDAVKILTGPVVWARPAAYARLRGSGVDLRAWRELGPAVALECHHKGLHIDRQEWTVAVEDGELLVSSRLERCDTFDRLRTGVRGRLLPEVCSCGLPDPLLHCDE